MGTITKEIADQVIAGGFASDRPRKIVKYTNAWGDEAYGLICAHESQDRYQASQYVINPSVYWTVEQAAGSSAEDSISKRARLWHESESARLIDEAKALADVEAFDARMIEKRATRAAA